MKNRDRGSITIEALLLIPALFIFGTLIVYAGRLTDASISVHHAADVAARVASQSNSAAASYRALQTAHQELSLLKTGCEDADIQVKKISNAGTVSYAVRIQCLVNTRGLGLLSLAPKYVHATSTEIVDVFTAR